MVVPPLIAAIAADAPAARPSVADDGLCCWRSPRRGSRYLAPAYTERPLRAARARDAGRRRGTAIWEVGSIEPGLDLGEGAPRGWTPVSGRAAGVGAVAPLPHPFVFRADRPSAGPGADRDRLAHVEPLADGTELSVTVVPREPGLAVSFVLPPGCRAGRSNLPGVRRRTAGRPPTSRRRRRASLFRASFAADDREALRLRIVATDVHRPPAGARLARPPWLPQERTAWTAEATWIVAPFALPIAPVPPLR